MNIWDIVILQPMINIIVALSHFLLDNYGLTIIVITIVIRAILLPLTLKQLRASKKMQDLQPQLQELQKKFAKDRQKLAQEQMKMYKESGVSASGCAVPMLIQFLSNLLLVNLQTENSHHLQFCYRRLKMFWYPLGQRFLS